MNQKGKEGNGSLAAQAKNGGGCGKGPRKKKEGERAAAGLHTLREGQPSATGPKGWCVGKESCTRWGGRLRVNGAAHELKGEEREADLR